MQISIVTPLYNKDEFLSRAIESVLNQNHKDWELIIVDDGSTDNSASIAKKYSAENANIYYFYQKNQGVSAARNYGVSKASFEFIAFLDADDTWETQYLECINDLMENYHDAKIFGTSYFILKNNQKKNAIIKGVRLPFDGYLKSYFSVASISDPPLWTSAVVVNKKAFNEVGGFPHGVASGEDLITWAKIVSKYPFAWTSKPLANFYAPENIEARKGRKPQVPDIVAIELKNIANQSKDDMKKQVISYEHAWHKMRANIYIRLEHKSLAWGEIKQMIQLIPFHKKNILYLCVWLIPSFILRKILK